MKRKKRNSGEIGMTEILIGAGILYLLTREKGAGIPVFPGGNPVTLPGGQKPQLPAVTQSLYNYGTAGLLGFIGPKKDLAAYTSRVAAFPGTSSSYPARYQNQERGWQIFTLPTPFNGYDLSPIPPFYRVARFTI